jgi:hypothetical protein
MSDADVYHGRCFCGAVQFIARGEPAGMRYCNRESCRHGSAGPVDAFVLWKPEALRVIRGANEIGTCNTTPHGLSKWCRRCGGRLFTLHPELGLLDVCAANIDGFPFKQDAPPRLKTGGSGSFVIE